ncbi:MAG TPA: exodeoxyribonuclease VII small subunit [Polyangiales bacterium]
MEKAGQAKQDEAPAFEDILGRLSHVVERLESGEVALEESLALFEEGVRLSRIGTARLDEAERRVERLLHDDGTTGPAREYESEFGSEFGSKETDLP